MNEKKIADTITYYCIMILTVPILLVVLYCFCKLLMYLAGFGYLVWLGFTL